MKNSEVDRENPRHNLIFTFNLNAKTFYMLRALSAECQILGAFLQFLISVSKHRSPAYGSQVDLDTAQNNIFPQVCDYNIYCHINL